MMMKEDIRFRPIGDLSDLPLDLQQQLDGVIQETKNNRSMTLNIALSYSGREEILRAARLIVEDAKKGSLTDIDEKTFAGYLYTAGQADPDLLIRTSGEMRLSNFLLWQIAYTEIYVTDTLWPDFRREAYEKALADFEGRDRRFGSLKEA
jgi:undecaprenyl diphosphate synthase